MIALTPNKRPLALALLLVGIVADRAVSAPAQERADLVLKGGRIVDGTGAPWYAGDVAVRNGEVMAIGRLELSSAERVVDATGPYVAPGFIDMMGQTGAPFLKNPRAADNLLTQGITTINAGEGDSDAPRAATNAQAENWQTMSEFFTIVPSGASALPRSMSEANVIKALRCDFISFCTDMGPLGSSDALVHPRGSGAFPRILSRYVRELEIVPLEAPSRG